MNRLDETRQIRIAKLRRLKELGVEPFQSATKRTHAIADCLQLFPSLVRAKKTVVLAGRIHSIRRHGGSAFIDISDGTGQFQVFVTKDGVGESNYDLFREYIDPGDFVEFRGSLFYTKQRAPTLQVSGFQLLTKSLRAIPETHFGLKDAETRLRKRYLDLAANPDTRDLFRKKALFWRSIRNQLEEQGFLDVQTPVLEEVPGGAEAEPFVTHHNTLDRDFFLRISLELPLKRLLVGGFEKVYEIGRIFRNEGISSEHLQDYTQMEFYWAYADYVELQKFLITFYRRVIKDTCGKLKISHDGRTVDWGTKWLSYDYYQKFQEYTGLDLASANENDLKKLAATLHITFESYVQKGRLIDLIYKKAVRPNLIEPGFLMNPPVEIEPLAKRIPNETNRVQRLQVVAWGTELGKGFSELNDPIDQRERFEEQMKLRAGGDKEAQPLDDDYIEALEYGLPPTAGFGLSERLFAVIMDKPIRETTLFPPMKKIND